MYVAPKGTGRRSWERALQIRVMALHQKDMFTAMIPRSNRIEDVVDKRFQFLVFSRHH